MLEVTYVQYGRSGSKVHGPFICDFWNLKCHAALFIMSDIGPSPTSHV